MKTSVGQFLQHVHPFSRARSTRMGQTATEEQFLYREQQQAAVARLGQVALGGLGLQALMGESVTLLAKHLGVEYAKMLELMPDGSRMLLRAGVGWHEGLVGHWTVEAGADTQAGFTLLAQEPVIVSDLRAETRFSGSPLLHDHGVISGISAVIPGRDRPYGVLGIHTYSHRTFTEYDVNFLLSVANVLAMAVERHTMEMELHQSRDQLKEILGGVADGITAQDESGQLVYANDAAAGLIGAPDADGLVSRFRILDTEGNPFPTEELPGRRALRGEEAAEALLCYQRQDTGELRWAQVKATPLRDDDGRPRLAINIFRDVTDSRQAEEALRASEARYRGLYGAIEAGVVVHDQEGKIVDANDMAAEVLGLDLDQMLGKEPMDPSWKATMEDGTPFAGEQHPAMVSLRTGVRVRNVTMGVHLPTGEKRWLLVNSAPITDGRGAETRGAVATFVDITERK
ncbi:MAG TPA: PAS domain-containing protein, partial [Chloroflexota bacterium]|nr:PAS domain-containing protein [Chloroflexota bacterium]